MGDTYWRIGSLNAGRRARGLVGSEGHGRACGAHCLTVVVSEKSAKAMPPQTLYIPKRML